VKPFEPREKSEYYIEKAVNDIPGRQGKWRIVWALLPKDGHESDACVYTCAEPNPPESKDCVMNIEKKENEANEEEHKRTMKECW
jgi:hypothetical protein